MSQNRRWVGVLAAALVVGLIAGCSGAKSKENAGDSVITMKIAYTTANDTQDQAGKLLKQRIETDSKGRIKVELFPAGQLGSNEQIIQGVSGGTVEAVLQPTGFLGGFAPVLTVADLPFLWPDRETVEKVLNSPEVSKPMYDVLSQKGIKGLAFYEYGAKNYLTTFPLSGVEALKGHKFRVMQAPVLIDQFKTWGVSAIPTAIAEVYTALQQRTIDGIENTPDHFYQNKYFEVAPYFTESGHGHLVLVCMANQKWFNSLPADLQDVIAKDAIGIAPDVRKWGEEKDKDSLDKMKASGKLKVQQLSKDQIEWLKTTSKPVYDTFVQKNPGADQVLKAIKQKLGS